MRYQNVMLACLRHHIWLLCLLAICPIAGRWAKADDTSTENRRVIEFATSDVTFYADFEGARLNKVTLKSNGEYQIVISPENEPINDSAWYAFGISAKMPKTVTIDLNYEGGKHRYHPKVSTDGINWHRLAPDRFSRDKQSTTLQVDVGPKMTWISAQEMIGGAELNAWMNEIALQPFAEDAIIGRSVGERPIRQLTIREGEPKYAVAIIGRQHPPEVTGSIALMEFVETIAGTSDLAIEFRKSFETTVIPLVNPDGVAAGNWRHNLHGVDLNRDWGPFKQPETQVVRDAILKYQSDKTARLALFLDFHSMAHDVFYVEIGDNPVWPADFCLRWLKALDAQMPNYKVRLEPYAGKKPYSKVWTRKTMNVPSMIYEVGDETDRALIRRVANAAANIMMRMLLDEADGALSRRPMRPR